jgi:uncharacterized NAD(P)/FAD-binding protein YdhS
MLTGDVILTIMKTPTQKIAIIGAGFTGVALAAALHRYATQPISITLFEKTGLFGAGDAYRTPYTWHLLNGRACDMSALADDPDHFVRWLQASAATYLEDERHPGREFVPRVLYHQYLCSLLATIFQDEDGPVQLHLVPEEVKDLESTGAEVKVIYGDHQAQIFDRVVLAHGNHPPASLAGLASADVQMFDDPWEYMALKNIPAKDPVLIVGTGLSMVDAVLTLHHQHHHGKIYALSRRGLTPLPHTDVSQVCAFDATSLPTNLRAMFKVLRHEAEKLAAQGGDWRAIIHQVRLHLPDIWQKMDEVCKKRFLRHVLPYWNVHRHRVHAKIYDLLADLRTHGQLDVIAGNLIKIEAQEAHIRLRKRTKTDVIKVKHVINCMGAGHDVVPERQPLLSALIKRGHLELDTLKLGMTSTEKFEVKTRDGKVLPACYTVGPPIRGEVWECVAVPEIRKQCQILAKLLLCDETSVSFRAKRGVS